MTDFTGASLTGATDPSATAGVPREVCFIDGALPDVGTLRAAAGPGAEVHVLDAAGDGLARMAAVLAGRAGLNAIHLLSHGAPGSLNVGATVLDGASFASHRHTLAAIGRALGPGGDLLLYGCNLAQGAAGLAFIEALAQATGADVAASTDRTGAARAGGNWQLQARVGDIEARVIAPADYAGVLESPDVAGDTATVGVLPMSGAVTGAIGVAGDTDWYAVTLVAGVTYRIEQQSLRDSAAPLSDSFLRLHDATGAVLVLDDDSGGNRDSLLVYTPEITGTFYASAEAYADAGTGGYRLCVLQTTEGNADVNTLTGGDNNDWLIGGAGNDTLGGGPGDDVLQGDDGEDTIVFTGNLADYRMTYNGATQRFTVSDTVAGRDGMDRATGVEFLQFADGTRAAATLASAPQLLVGGAGGDLLDGGDGNDTLQGLAGQDRLLGGAGDDLLEGGDDWDDLYGDVGNDTLLGGAGGGNLIGGAGDDSLVGGAGSDYFSGEAGNDTLVGGADQDSAVYDFGDAGAGVVFDGSTTGNAAVVDIVDGRGGVDRMDGIEGLYVYGSSHADSLTGGAGNDYLYGQSGDDTVVGGGGDDGLSGEADNDMLLGDTGSDTLDGGEGDDSLAGGAGNDTFVGGDGSDTIVFSGNYAQYSFVYSSVNQRFTVTDTVAGRDGIDKATGVEFLQFADGVRTAVSVISDWPIRNLLLAGTSGNDSLEGGDGNDTLQGLAGQDTLRGNAGDDLLEGGDDWDDLYGEAGNDTLLGSAGGGYLYGGAGDDSLVGGAGSDYLYGEAGNDTLLGGAGDDQARYEFWSASAGVVFDGSTTGTAAAVDIGDGQGGVDRLDGIEGLYVYGSNHADSLSGGDGNDYLDAQSGIDTVVGGGGDDVLYGGGDDDILHGDTGNDTLDGGDSADSLTGGAGNDAIAGGGGSDTAVFSGNYAQYSIVYSSANLRFIVTDTVASRDGIDTAMGVEFLQFADGARTTASVIGDWPVVSLLLVGTSGNDSLESGDGNDTLQGLAGQDTLRGNAGDDLLKGGDGWDNLFGDAGNDTLLGGAGGGYLHGGEGDDSLVGSAGSDYFYGEAGNDTLVGGADQDRAVYEFWSASAGVVFDGSTTGTAAVVNIGDGQGGVDRLDGIEGLYVDGSNHGDSLSGGDGNDYLSGRSGNDTVVSGGGDDELSGGGDDDILRGDTGNDMLDGGDGADSLTGGAGNDAIVGGGGSDTVVFSGTYAQYGIVYSSANLRFIVTDNMTGRDGIDTAVGVEFLQFAGGVRTAASVIGDWPVVNLLLAGTSGDDGLESGDGNDTLQGLAGQDTLRGNAGDDLLEGGDGWDNLFGDAGNDTLLGGTNGGYLYGGAGDDSLVGSAGNDYFYGEAGNDTLVGGADDDQARYEFWSAGAGVVFDGSTTGTAAVVDIGDGQGGIDRLDGIERLYVYGSIHADSLTGGAGSDYLYGQSGNDTVAGGGGDDELSGGADNDLLFGNAGSDRLVGGDGADTLDGGAGAGADVMDGGAGDDTFIVDLAGDLTYEGSDGGIDWVISAVDRALVANIENLRLNGTASSGTGNSLANRMEANAGQSSNLFGGDGADTLLGGAGNDTLNGGAGDDSMVGGTGNDDYAVDAPGDAVVETSADPLEIDRASALVSWALTANVEQLSLTGSGHIDATGNAQDNTLFGNSGNNVLDGGAGNDTMLGGLGNDTYIVDAGGDQTIEISALPGEIDTLIASINRTLSTNIENLTLVGGATTGAGNALANEITGNEGANNLLGVAGNDTLLGGAGNDTLNGGAGDDSMAGGAGNDVYAVDAPGDVVVENSVDPLEIDRVSASVSWALTTNVENLSLTGSGDIDATGNAQNNTLFGNSGNNVLDGGAGNDTMLGGLGNDSYIVDASGDQTIERSALPGEIDTIIASINRTLSTHIENLTLVGGATTGAGNALANTIAGNELPNSLLGVAGNDTLLGGAGDDTLNGGAGDDSMVGAAGNDVYAVDSAGDVVVETSADPLEIDRVSATVSWVLGDNVENLTLSGTAAINGTGNALANTIGGNPGANAIDGQGGDDTISGGDGNDTLTGGAGNDRLTGGNGADRFRFVTTADGSDTITDFVSGSDKILVVAANFGLVAGAGANLFVNAAASSAAAAFLYDTGTGSLSFDADGNGAGAAVQLALLSTKPGIIAGDIVLGP